MSIEHEAFWLLKQLHKEVSNPDWFINIRAIHNLRPYMHEGKLLKSATKVTFNENIRIADFKQRWYSNLLQHLVMLNESDEPSNIYFGVNPRTSGDPSSNKVEHVAGYLAFYLDCDDNKSYTKEQRAYQLQFWRDYGLAPSITVDSGHGYHVYWLLKQLEPAARQEMLKRMVLLAGCKDKGSTHDVTRVLRLPGFKNVKQWFNNDFPQCYIYEPLNWQELDRTFTYECETLGQWFPPSERENIENYHARAVSLGESVPFTDRVRQIAQAAVQAELKSKIEGHGVSIAAEKQKIEASANFQQQTSTDKKAFEPTLGIVPPIDELKFPKGKGWMKKYCKKGYDGLSAEELENLQLTYGNDKDISASALDGKVMYFLIKAGFTYPAAVTFWKSIDLKLWRQDKMDKNPNYLQMTYDSMLASVRSALELGHNEATAKFQPHIGIVNHETLFFNDQGIGTPVLTGELTLLAKYIDEDAALHIDREWFEVRVHCKSHGELVAYDLLLPGAAFASISNFKTHATGDHLRVLVDKSAYLQYVIKHLENEFPDVHTHRFHSKIVYSKDQFVFPKFICAKNGPRIKDDAMIAESLAKKFDVYKWFDNKFLKPEKVGDFLANNWKHLLRFHLPRVIVSILGTIASSALKPIFEDKLLIEDFNLPTINIRGASHSGKTETVKKLCRLTGVIGGKNSVSTETTNFAVQRTIELTNFIPMIIDEFKISDHNSKNIEMVRSLVRRMYSGESMMRGRADLTVTNIRLHGALIVVGEHALERLGDVSEISRVIPISTDEYEPERHITEYFEVSETHWEWLAPHFYSFILNQDPEKLYDEFRALRLQVIDDLSKSFAGEKLRVGHNLATIWYGCRMWDKFVQSYCPDIETMEKIINPQKYLVDYIKSWSIESKQSLVLTEVKPDASVVSVVYANNEFFKLLETITEMEEIKDKIWTERGIEHIYEEEGDRLYLRLNAAHALYREYMKKQNKIVPEERKLSSLLAAAEYKKESWIIEPSKPLRRKDKKSSRYVIMHLPSLIKMGIWKANLDEKPKKATESSPKSENLPPSLLS